MQFCQNAAFKVLNDLCTRRGNNFTFGVDDFVDSGKACPTQKQQKRGADQIDQAAGAAGLFQHVGFQRCHAAAAAASAA